MSPKRTVDQETLLDFLTLDAARRPKTVDPGIAAVAASIENELGPGLRQLGANADTSEYESETECLVAIANLASLPQSPFLESGAVRFLREYELLDELGSGGMGTVFRARHAKLGKLFAVKVLSPKLPHNDQTVSRFLHEMRAAGQIEHPNVVCATDAGEVDGIHYLVMEFVDGVNLSQLVKATGPLTLADACEIVRLAALGLQAVHDHGLVHRDIKPSNLMLESRAASGPWQEREDTDSRDATWGNRPSIKILDLGLALLHDSSAASVSGASGRVVGTTKYMAPEQFVDSQNVDARADLYSLGCTLHYLFSGRSPTPGRLEPSGNAEVDRILERLLSTDPANRFASAADVAIVIKPNCADADLGRLALRGRQVRTAQIDTVASQSETREFAHKPEGEETPSRRRGGLLVAASVILVCCAIFTTWSIMRTRLGELVLTINEPHATVLVDGKIPSISRNASGDVTVQLALGKHNIKIQADGHQPWSDDITIVSRKPEHLVVRLAPRDQKAPQEQEATGTGTPTSPDLDTRERQLAMWVLKRGGSLRLYPRGDINDEAQLPPGRVRIQSVILSRKRLRDEDVARFVGMSNLQSLELSHNQLTTRATEHLSRIPTLRWLYLPGNQGIDDGGAKYLAQIEGLRALDLSLSQVTDATVAEIKTLKHLRELRLASTKVTSDCLEHISALTGIVRLDLSATRVTDEGLDQLSKLSALKYLLLTFTDISDDAVENLKVLSALRELKIISTKLSPASVEELRQALPQCQVTF